MDKVQNNALLVRVKCTRWQHSFEDKGLASELTHSKGASDGVLKVRKTIAQQPVVRALDKLIGQVGNQIVRKMTLRWDEGEHLLTVENIDRFEDAIRDKNDKLEANKAELRVEWPTIIAVDKNLLGSTFDADLYPTADEVCDSYSITYSLKPLPSSDDIRVSLPDEKIKLIKKSVEDEINQKIESAMERVHSDVLTALENLIEGLERHGKKEGNAKRASKFGDNTVEEIKRIAEILPSLNLTGDPVLAQAGNKLLTKLRDLDPKQLRESKSKRKETVAQAKEIVDSLSGFFD